MGIFKIPPFTVLTKHCVLFKGEREKIFNLIQLDLDQQHQNQMYSLH